MLGIKCSYRSLTVVLLAAALFGTSLFAADYAAEGRLWWAHVQFLAADKLQGRNTGSAEFIEAVKYVEAQFERIGLAPAGTSGYRQPVRFESRTLTDPSIELLRDGKAEAVAVGEEASLSSRAEMPAVVEAPLVFTGYGMSIPEAHYDDLAGLDLRGKIAVYVNAAGPVEASGNVKSHFSSAGERWAVFHKAGAIGMASLPNPRPNAPSPAAGGRGASFTPPPSVVLADRDLQQGEGEQIALTITRRGAEKFFAGSGHTFAEIEGLAKENKPLPRFPLAATLRAKATLHREAMEAPNVAAHVARLGREAEGRIRDHVGAPGPRGRGATGERRQHLQRRHGQRFRHRVGAGGGAADEGNRAPRRSGPCCSWR